jgi:transposase
VHLENIVKETLEIKNHKITSIEKYGDNLFINLDVRKHRKLECSICGKKAPRFDRQKERNWMHVPFWGICVFLTYRPCRVKCLTCGVRIEKYPWAQGKQTLTTALVNVLSRWCQLLPIETVATMYGLQWNTVYTAVKNAVKYGLEHRELTGVLFIGIDEISRRKGQKYLTNVYDLGKKTLLWSGAERTEETLRTFFKGCSKEMLAQIQGVCCDMWEPYEKVVKEYIPHAIFVFDKFHIVSHLQKEINKVRIEEYQEVKKSNPGLLNKSKYLFLKKPENLTDKQEIRLSYLLKLNLRSVKAYLLKEEFRLLWDCTSIIEAKVFLKSWLWRATHSRLEPLRNFAWMVKRHIEGILAWFKLPISNGIVEALNNTAKAISHRARGYRLSNTFSTVLLLCMGGLKLPETTHSFL